MSGMPRISQNYRKTRAIRVQERHNPQTFEGRETAVTYK